MIYLPTASVKTIRVVESMGLADLLQAPGRKMKIEPKSDTHYMKEGGLSSIFAVISADGSFQVHGFDQRPVL
jgi:hypothetical protein